MARTGFNDVNVLVYRGFDGNLRHDIGGVFDDAQITFSTFYPGGLYGAAEMRIPVDDPRNAAFMEGLDKVKLKNAHSLIWEGQITSIDQRFGAGARQEIVVQMTGYWGSILGRTLIDKRWADDRIDGGTWVTVETGSMFDAASERRQGGGIQVDPRGGGDANIGLNNRYTFTYSMPTGGLVRRVALTDELQEGSFQFETELLGSASIWTRAVTGSGARDDNLGTPVNQILLRFSSKAAAQSPPSDGTVFGRFTDIVVYSETGAINLTEIAEDIVGLVGELHGNTDRIISNTLALEPFYTDGPEPVSEILLRAASYGDSSQNQWAVYVSHSEASFAPKDHRPPLIVEQYPDPTDYTYTIRMDDPNVAPPIQFGLDYDYLANYIVITYTDLSGHRQVITPVDDANLKDQDSIDFYGQRELPKPLHIRTADATTATNVGRRVLAKRKDPRWYVKGPIRVKGHIGLKGFGGFTLPASEIIAGQNIRIVSSITAPASTSLILLITQTQYDDRTEVCRITAGRPDDLSVFLAQRQLIENNVFQ